MTIKHYIAAALASFVALASVAPALANFDYYEGADINAKRGATSAAKKPDGRATGSIRTKAATFGFPSTAKPVPQVAKGGEGEYYQGLSRQR